MGVAVFGGQIQAPCEPLWGAAVGKAASFFTLPYSLLPGRVLSQRLALTLLHVVLKAERTLNTGVVMLQHCLRLLSLQRELLFC